MEQVREQANQLAFQQKLAKMEPQQRAAAIKAMGNMSAIERKNFMDMVNFGSVINKEGAAAAAMSTGLTDSVNASYAAFNAGKLDEIEQRKIAGQYGDQIKKDMLDNTAIGLAGAAGVGGLVGQLSDSMGQELQYRNKFTAEAIKAAEEAAAAQKNTKDTLTQGVTDAATAAQELKISLEKVLTPAIAKFAEVSGKILSAVEQQLKEFNLDRSSGKVKDPDEDEDPGEKSTLQKIGRAVLEIGGGYVGTTIGGAAGGLAGTAVPGVGNAALGFAGGVAGGVAGSWLGSKAADLLGFARGGMPTGPDSGYPVMLHGTEAVIPLGGQREVPVQLDTGALKIDTDSLAKSIRDKMPSPTVAPVSFNPSSQFSSMAKSMSESITESGIERDKSVKDLYDDIQKSMTSGIASASAKAAMPSSGSFRDLTKALAMNNNITKMSDQGISTFYKETSSKLGDLNKNFITSQDAFKDGKLSTDKSMSDMLGKFDIKDEIGALSKSMLDGGMRAGPMGAVAGGMIHMLGGDRALGDIRSIVENAKKSASDSVRGIYESMLDNVKPESVDNKSSITTDFKSSVSDMIKGVMDNPTTQAILKGASIGGLAGGPMGALAGGALGGVFGGPDKDKASNKSNSMDELAQITKDSSSAQMEMLSQIKELLSGSKDLHQQLVYNSH